MRSVPASSGTTSNRQVANLPGADRGSLRLAPDARDSASSKPEEVGAAAVYPGVRCVGLRGQPGVDIDGGFTPSDESRRPTSSYSTDTAERITRDALLVRVNGVDSGWGSAIYRRASIPPSSRRCYGPKPISARFSTNAAGPVRLTSPASVGRGQVKSAWTCCRQPYLFRHRDGALGSSRQGGGPSRSIPDSARLSQRVSADAPRLAAVRMIPRRRR